MKKFLIGVASLAVIVASCAAIHAIVDRLYGNNLYDCGDDE